MFINGHGGQIATPRRWGTPTDSIETLSGTGIDTGKFKITTFMVGFSKGTSDFWVVNRNFLELIRASKLVSLLLLATSQRWGVAI